MPIFCCFLGSLPADSGGDSLGWISGYFLLIHEPGSEAFFCGVLRRIINVCVFCPWSPGDEGALLVTCSAAVVTCDINNNIRISDCLDHLDLKISK